MKIQELHPATEHERVVECIDEAVGYHAIIAIHSTALGPAIGGTRVWPYRSFDDALTDALRLSRGMSYKTAIAGLRLGGGKSVILADSRFLNREPIFRAHGRFINYFHGEYITGEDIGTSPRTCSSCVLKPLLRPDYPIDQAIRRHSLHMAFFERCKLRRSTTGKPIAFAGDL